MMNFSSNDRIILKESLDIHLIVSGDQKMKRKNDRFDWINYPASDSLALNYSILT